MLSQDTAVTTIQGEDTITSDHRSGHGQRVTTTTVTTDTIQGRPPTHRTGRHTARRVCGMAHTRPARIRRAGLPYELKRQRT